MGQTTYSVDSIKYVLGQVADTSLKQIDSFQLVNKSTDVRSYAKFGDIVYRFSQGDNSTANVVNRAETAAQQKKTIGIVVRDDSYGLDTYTSSLAADTDDTVIKRDVLNVLRKGRIAVKVGVGVIITAGDPAFPIPMAETADHVTAQITYAKIASVNEQIGVFVTSAAAGELAIVEIDFTN